MRFSMNGPSYINSLTTWQNMYSWPTALKWLTSLNGSVEPQADTCRWILINFGSHYISKYSKFASCYTFNVTVFQKKPTPTTTTNKKETVNPQNNDNDFIILRPTPSGSAFSTVTFMASRRQLEKVLYFRFYLLMLTCS